MSNKLIADLMSFRSRMVTDLRTQVMFEGDFDTIDQAIAELKKLSTDLQNWKDFCKKVQRQQLASQPSVDVLVEALREAIKQHLDAYAYVVDVEKDYREYGIGGGTYTSDAMADANKKLVDSIQVLATYFKPITEDKYK